MYLLHLFVIIVVIIRSAVWRFRWLLPSSSGKVWSAWHISLESTIPECISHQAATYWS